MSVNAKKSRMIIISVLFVIEIISVFLMFKSSSNKETVLEEVKLRETVVVPDGLAIMLETENADGTFTYKESENSNWPTTGYKYNSEKSGCIDKNGNKIEDALSYNSSNNMATVSTGVTSYCYIYFDIKYTLSQLCSSGDNLGSCLTSNNEEIDSLGDTAYSEMYRYTGTNEIVDDNYVCFGTTDKEECTSNPDTYMYRVIGVTSAANSTLGLAANQVKVIKAATIGNYNWHGSYTSDIKWESSAMYTYLQGSNVLGNTSVIPSGWSDKISSVKWNIGDVQTYTNGDTVYGLEDNTQTTNTSKVGLMYSSDYYYAYIAGGTTNCNITACTNWLTDTSNTTWTMSRYGDYGNGYYHAWYVYSNGFVYGALLYGTFAVRPAFYLNGDEQYISGDGTLDNPIMLADKEVPTVTATINNNNSSSPSMTITSTEAGTYCVNTSATETTSCTFTGSIAANGSITTTAFTSNGTYYAHVTDAAGNIGNSSAVSVTVSQPFGEYLLANPTTGLDATTPYSGMYRYIGTDTSVNNYVKIGDVLYRIIGVTSEANNTLGLATNQVKVIKAATIGYYMWHGNKNVNATWNTGGTDAAMYTYLQNDVLSNTSYIPSEWSNKISSVKWNVGDVQTYTNTNGDTVYGLEDNTQTTNTSKVGLMYLSDWYYAYNAGGTQNCSISPYCVSWMTDTSNKFTWTMSRSGHSNSYFRAWGVTSAGSVEAYSLRNENEVRPVFYLSTSVNWKSGTGTSGDPFIIE